MMNDGAKKRLLSMIALARKAGKLITGEEGCEKAIRHGVAHLVFIAADASTNTQKKFNNKATFYGAQVCDVFTKDEISRHTGLHNRATFVVTDESFSNKMIEIIEKSDLAG